jgi:hypothetical protein
VLCLDSKSATLLGLADPAAASSPSRLGTLPTAIIWLYRLIDATRARATQPPCRFSVRVSAIEVTGTNERVVDLLAGLTHAGRVTVN